MRQKQWEVFPRMVGIVVLFAFLVMGAACSKSSPTSGTADEQTGGTGTTDDGGSLPNEEGLGGSSPTLAGEQPVISYGAGSSTYCSGSVDEAGIYVSLTGNDATGDGSIDRPYRHIGYALAQSQAGDTIVLRGGTYVLNGETFSIGGTTYPEEVRVRNASITIKSRNGEKAIIQCPIDHEADYSICVQFDPDADGGKLKCLEIAGGYYYGVSFETKWDWGDPNDRSGATDIAIEDCTIRDTGRDSVKIKPGSDGITIRRSEISGSGARDGGNAEGIDNVNGDRMLVQDSFIHDTATTGIYFKGGATDCVVERTRVEHTGAGGIMVGFDTSPEYFDTTANPDYYESIRGVVRNSIVVDTVYAGIGMYAAKDAQILNNTIVDAAKTAHSPIYFGVTLQDSDDTGKRPPNANPTIKNNIIVHGAGNANPCVGIRYATDIDIWDYDQDPAVFIGPFDFSGLDGMPTMDHNLYFKSGGTCTFDDGRPTSLLSDGNLAQWQTHIAAEANALEADPGLDADEHLTAGSPAIDAGETLTEVIYDIDRQTRVALYDIGADEYQ